MQVSHCKTNISLSGHDMNYSLVSLVHDKGEGRKYVSSKRIYTFLLDT